MTCYCRVPKKTPKNPHTVIRLPIGQSLLVYHCKGSKRIFWENIGIFICENIQIKSIHVQVRPCLHMKGFLGLKIFIINKFFFRLHVGFPIYTAYKFNFKQFKATTWKVCLLTPVPELKKSKKCNYEKCLIFKRKFKSSLNFFYLENHKMFQNE